MIVVVYMQAAEALSKCVAAEAATAEAQQRAQDAEAAAEALRLELQSHVNQVCTAASPQETRQRLGTLLRSQASAAAAA